MKEILELAQQLGQKIAESDEIRTFQEMERIYAEDEQAQKVMAEYEKERAALTVKAKDVGMTPESLQMFQQEMKKSMDKLMANATVREYLDAKASFNEIIEKVNAIISYCISGEDQELAQEGSCSGNCSSCSGCH